MEVYVYVDTDNDRVEVFDTLMKAQNHAETQWGEGDEWEENHETGPWIYAGGYVKIHRRQVKGKSCTKKPSPQRRSPSVRKSTQTSARRAAKTT